MKLSKTLIAFVAMLTCTHALAADINTGFQKLKIKASGLEYLVGAGNVMVTGKSKEEVLSDLKESEAAILLDDEPEHVKVGEKLGLTAYLYKTKHNSGVTPEGIPKFEHERAVSSFPEFVKLLEKEWSQAA